MQGIVDIHCHILPRVDDGASGYKEAVALLRMEREQGVQKVILTPHFRRGVFETDQSEINRRFEKLREVIEERTTLGIELYLGCEYHNSSRMVDELTAGMRPTLAGSRYVLSEFSYRESYARVRERVYDLIVKGYVPIIAHVERYSDVVKNLDQVQELLRLGARMQITTGAVYGKHGFSYKRICKKLLNEDMVQFIATDAHDMSKRMPDIQRCVEYIEKKKGADYARKIFVDNPNMILGDRYIKYE